MDADARVDPNYLQALVVAFFLMSIGLPGNVDCPDGADCPDGCSIYFEHPLEGDRISAGRLRCHYPV